MSTPSFEQQVILTVADKGLLALIVVLAGHKLNQALEGIKSRLSREQEYDRAISTAVVDLTKKLAAGSHLISWIAWSATQNEDTLSKDDFAAYGRDMRTLMSELVGYQAALAALDPAKFEVLSPFAERLYVMDEEMGKASDLYSSSDTWKIANARVILRDCFFKALRFDAHLLAASVGLLRAPADAKRSEPRSA